VDAIIELARVPRSAIMERHFDRPAARAALLSGGDDYELSFTARRSRRGAVERVASRAGLKVTRIGRTVAARRGAVSVIGEDGKPVAVRHPGFDHFG
jgi:thiamine-monophosphate kinase